MSHEAITQKVMFLGIDGMDPHLANKYLRRGVMPNLAEYMRRGACREDLVMLGAQPTITPPMWTTLSTGAYPMTHGITCFKKQGERLDELVYGMGTNALKAEQLWDCFVEAGKKTLVWQWPGCSWPPTKDDENLFVVDGTQPTFVNFLPVVDAEAIVIADVATEEVTYKPQAASDGNVPCVVKDLEEIELGEAFKGTGHLGQTILILNPEDGEHALSDAPFNIAFSPIKDAGGWANAPADAKEFVLLLNFGFIRRNCLVLKNEQGIYDKIAIYKNKKATEPMIVLEKNVYVRDVVDDGYYNDSIIANCNRDMLLMDVAADGTHVQMWVSGTSLPGYDEHFYPRALYHEIVENVGMIPPMSNLSGNNERFIGECQMGAWEHEADWQVEGIHYMIEKHGIEAVFCHYHNVDQMAHQCMKFLKERSYSKMSPKVYDILLQKIYMQADRYIGKFLHLLDEGWSIAVVSDHGQVCPDHEPKMMGDGTGVNIRFMEELGLTALKKDENGNDLREIDWEHTYAVAPRGNHIYLNIKGRQEQGIIDPKDQYEWEEEIMTRLYGYKDPETGKRVVALALRNKDAALLGMSGPECGDIVYFMAEGYHIDHGDTLSTTTGVGESSVSPFCVLAGKGIKENFRTERVIRQVDIAPTMAYLAGVRMPKNCEGSIVYQILAEEF